MLLIVDLDGVVYRGREAVPGVPELLRRRVESGDSIVYCTNNSAWHRSEYVERLRSVGAPVGEEMVVTSARATALSLSGGDGSVGAVMVLGGEGLIRELEEVGLRVVPPTEAGLSARPAVVVVGIDFALSYERLSCAAEAIRSGARFVATNRDPVYPTPTRLLAGAGTIVAAVEAAAGRSPDLVVGKPEPALFVAAAAAAGGSVRDAVVIGDSLVSDIPAARRVGARSILMLTGVTTAGDIERLGDQERPTAIARDAAELARALDEMR